MGSVRQMLVRFLRNEDGPTAVEYAVMLALLLMACFVAVVALGTTTNQTFNEPALNSSLVSPS